MLLVKKKATQSKAHAVYPIIGLATLDTKETTDTVAEKLRNVVYVSHSDMFSNLLLLFRFTCFSPFFFIFPGANKFLLISAL